jgi:hypothetical protein
MLKCLRGRLGERSSALGKFSQERPGFVHGDKRAGAEVLERFSKVAVLHAVWPVPPHQVNDQPVGATSVIAHTLIAPREVNARPLVSEWLIAARWSSACGAVHRGDDDCVTPQGARKGPSGGGSGGR